MSELLFIIPFAVMVAVNVAVTALCLVQGVEIGRLKEQRHAETMAKMNRTKG